MVSAALLLVVLLPLLLAVGLLVRVSSPGPLIFRQQRVGRCGRRFTLYKFRTMVDGNDPSAHKDFYSRLVRGEVDASVHTFKIVGDPRVTPIGQVLRRFSLDELPQLVNVLTGDMSLVGPRPPIPYEVDLYGRCEYARLSVTPGLTGLWQISGRGTLSFQEMIELDLAYINAWSLILDLRILIRTPWLCSSAEAPPDTARWSSLGKCDTACCPARAWPHDPVCAGDVKLQQYNPSIAIVSDVGPGCTRVPLTPQPVDVSPTPELVRVACRCRRVRNR